MRYLFGYNNPGNSEPLDSRIKSWMQRLKDNGINIESLNLSPDHIDNRYSWMQLDRAWKIGDKQLLTFYENISRKTEHFDVFINYNGVNLHPRFVEQLNTINVFSCFDDPESSDDLSRPVASSYDICMIGNIAEIDRYRSWGCRVVDFWPNGFHDEDIAEYVDDLQISSVKRDINISLFADRLAPLRRERFNEIEKSFKDGFFFGRGWTKGFISEDQKSKILSRTKLSINIHNSTGPVNSRTYVLPANGILQICDNKDHLAKLFELDKEVIGYETIHEAIDKARYYLSNDEERIRIARAGRYRVLNDYNEVENFQRLVRIIEQNKHEPKATLTPITLVRSRNRISWIIKISYYARKLFQKIIQK